MDEYRVTIEVKFQRLGDPRSISANDFVDIAELNGKDGFGPAVMLFRELYDTLLQVQKDIENAAPTG